MDDRDSKDWSQAFDATNNPALLHINSLLTPLTLNFSRQGHRLYLVGGVVRDIILGPQGNPGDIDLTTDADPGTIENLARGLGCDFNLAGVPFGTVGFRMGGVGIEITTHRSEHYRKDSRKPSVTAAPSLQADLSRRDFTINALALELTDPNPQLIDLFHGIEHMFQRRLVTPLNPRDSFEDDPLRILRAARFIARLGLTPDSTLVEAATSLSKRLEIVSAERIQRELTRLLEVPDPSAGLWFLVNVGAFDNFLPEVSALHLQQDPVHKHKDVLAHTIAVVAKCSPIPDLRLAALLHDIGKPATRRITDSGVTFHFHDVVGARIAKTRLTALKYPTRTISTVSRLVELHLRFHTYAQGWTDSAVRRYVRDAGPLLDWLNELTMCDATTRNDAKLRAMHQRMDDLITRINDLREREALDSRRPALNGTQIMELLHIPPSPRVGEAITYLLERQLDEGPLTEDDARKELLTWWNTRHSTLNLD